MQIIEMIGWVVLGFLPVLGGLEIVSRAPRYRNKAEARAVTIKGG